MKKYKKIVLLSVAFFTLLPASINSKAYAKDQNTVKKEQVAYFTGTVLDSKTGKPLRDVYVKQVNTLNTVLTDEKGNFSITVSSDGEKKLSIYKEGYEGVLADVLDAKVAIKITLFPAISFKNEDLPQPHSDSADLFNYSSKPISSNFNAMYQVEFKAGKIPSLTNNGGVFTRGWAINELGVNGQIRYNDILAQIKLYRGRFPVELDNFEYKPVYDLDSLQFQFGGGKVFTLDDTTDFYTGVNYMFHFITPDSKSNGDNKPIPFTNSYQDFPQTRQGPGVSAIYGKTINQSSFFNISGALYPFVISTFEGLSKNNIGYHGMLELSANAKMETISGVYLVGSYTNQLYFGFSNLLEDSNFISFGISLDPFKMAGLATGSKK